MLCKRGFLILVMGFGLLVATPAAAEEQAELKTPEKVETSIGRSENEATKHVSCQTECEKDGEDPYQCEEFCVLLVNWECTPSATVAAK